MLKPTTIFLGEKAAHLLHLMAGENGMAYEHFFTKLIIREARAEASMLSLDKLEERLKLIDEVADEQAYIVSNPTIEKATHKSPTTNPKSVYYKVWVMRERLKKKGWGEEEIHKYCMRRYGYDLKVKKRIKIEDKSETESVEVKHEDA